MRRTKVKKSVCFIIHQTKNGFSLVNTLFSLLIISSILLFIPSIYQLFHTSSYTSEFSIRQFFHILNNEIQTQTFDYHTEHTVHLINNKEENVTISLYGSVVRRQVNRKGHEILVRDIKKFSIKTVKNGIHVTITSLSGDHYAKTILFQ
ncbi:competence type IV pilus minor pilin ComGF [Paraliobacillus sp. JSM ZJ581]|uniref:competence type IV pilus minor pilin ComGF n=1 Tax=Paraliobacillus sp. JSM ZJ581 TaxID=3342118 RepID=UPI0035A9A3D2